MNDVSNRTILTTMVILGVITIGLLISQRQRAFSYSYPTYNNLGASAYDSGSYSYGTVTNTGGVYLPDIHTSYPLTGYRFNTTTSTSTYTTPTTKTYYYTTEGQLPDESGYNSTYTYDQGYVPAGCESGTDYSLTTGEACG